ncbi:MAG: hypothetical protein GF364_19095, partial [Candidatus Lokiarchaeota archaeon]|nr:hypothetical protein [Candidatus Lokiarchaeota archaeon]
MKYNKRKFYKINFAIIISMIFVVGIFSNINMILMGNENFISEQDVNSPESSEVPVGLIAMWSGLLNDIPTGWALCNGSGGTPDLRNRFLFGVSESDPIEAIGGLDSHNHTYSEVPKHSHAVNDPAHSHSINATTYEVDTGPDPIMICDDMMIGPCITYPSDTYIATELNGSTDCSTDNSTKLPPYYELAYIQKISTNAVVPKGLIMIWTDLISEVPEGWVICNGSDNTPNLTERFIRGVENSIDPGNKGGFKEHNHTYTMVPEHSHSITEGSHLHFFYSQEISVDFTGGTIEVYNCQPGGMPFSTNANDTDITLDEFGEDVCMTDNASSMPPYYEVKYIMKNNTEDILPVDVIGIWANDGEVIPNTFDYCDGLLGRPNLTNRFVYGAPVGVEAGGKGGFFEHNHTYTCIPRHTHTIFDPTHEHTVEAMPYFLVPGSPGIFAKFWDPDNGNEFCWTTEDTTGLTINEEGIDVCETDNATSMPPYFTVHFIQHTNTPPEAGNVGFVDTTLYTDNDIIASYLYSDDDTDPESGSEVRWYRNNIYQPQLDDLIIVQSEWTNKSDEWNYTLRPRDGKEFGRLVHSGKVTIMNTDPEANNIALDPGNPYT